MSGTESGALGSSALPRSGPSDADPSGTHPPPSLTARFMYQTADHDFYQFLPEMLRLNPRSAGVPQTRKTNLPRINTSTSLIRTPLPKKSAPMLCDTMYRKNGNNAKPRAGLSRSSLKPKIPSIINQGPQPVSHLTRQLRYGLHDGYELYTSTS